MHFQKITDEKEKLYNELEDLSQSLFEESNRLVSEEVHYHNLNH